MTKKDTKFNIIEFSLKHQRLAFFLTLILSLVSIVYALIYCTPLAPLASINGLLGEGVMYVAGAEIYYEVQPFNRMLLLFGFLQLGAVAISYIFFCQKRRVYYIGNYVSVLLFAGISVVLAFYSIIFNIIYMLKYLKVDFAMYYEVAQMFNEDYIESTYMFNLGIIIAILALFVSAFICLVAIGKYKNSKREFIEARLKEEEANV